MTPADFAQWMLTAAPGERIVYAVRKYKWAETKELGEMKRAAMKGWAQGRVRLIQRRIEAPSHTGLGAFELIAERPRHRTAGR